MKIRNLYLLLSLIGISPLIAQEFQKEGEEHNRERESWLDMLHQCEPGLSWRAIERENAVAAGDKAAERKAKIQDATLGSDDYMKGVWSEVGSNNLAGRIHTLDYDAETNEIYAASAGGNVWRGFADGSGWRSLNDQMQFDIQSIKILKKEGKIRIVVFDYAKIYYSDDDGATWQISATDSDIYHIKDGVALRDGTDALYAYTLADGNRIKILCSRDRGATFTTLFTKNYQGQHFGDIWAHDFKACEPLVFIVDSLYKINQKDELIPYTQHTPPFNYSNSCVVIGNGGYARLAAQSSNGTTFYKCSEGGEYQQFSSVNQGIFMHNAFASLDCAPDNLFFGGVNCYTGSDIFGDYNFNAINTWDQYYNDINTKLHADICGIKSFRDREGKEIIFYCTDGGIFTSDSSVILGTPDERKVKNISLKGLNVSQYYSVLSHKTNPKIIYAGAQDQGMQRTLEAGSKPAPFKQIISGDYGHLRSEDGGKSVWFIYPGMAFFGENLDEEGNDRLGSSILSGSGRVWIPPIAVFPGEPTKALIASGSDKGPSINRMTYSNGAVNIQTPAKGFSGWDVPSAIAFNPFDGDSIFLASASGGFYVSIDSGNTWKQISYDDGRGLSHYLYGSCLVPSNINRGTIYIAGSGYSNPSVYVSTNSGVSFTPMSDGLPSCAVFRIAPDENEKYIYAATSAGPYVYDPDVKKWLYIPGAPIQTFWDCEYIADRKIVRFATYGRGIWDYHLDGVISAEDKSYNAPKLSLTVAPNPANEKAEMTLTSEKNGFVEITLYDLQGAAVAKIYSGEAPAGELKIDAGKSLSGLPSGAYTAIARMNGQISFVKINIQR